MKPLIFIDAYINTPEKEEVFVKNVNNFIDAGYDLFIISNKLVKFDKFDKVKYFEYDSRNRLLKDKYGYKSASDSCFFIMKKQYIDYMNGNKEEDFNILAPIFNPTNLSVLYNTRRMCEVAKEFGYTNIMRVDYDCIFDRYDFENTFLKDAETSDWNNYGVAAPGCFGIYINWVYLNIDYFIKNIPLIKTEDQYKEFLLNNFGELKYLTFEKIIYTLLNKIRILTPEENELFIGVDTNLFTTDEQTNRLDVFSEKLLVVVANDKSLLVLENQYPNSIDVNITIDNNSPIIQTILPNCSMLYNCVGYKTIKVTHLNQIKLIDENIIYNATLK